MHPGESRREEIILNKLYKLDQPGKYTVQMQRGDGKIRFSPDEPKSILVESNKVTFTLAAGR